MLESLLLLLFITWGLAIFMRLFTMSIAMGKSQESLQTAVTMARNAAEEFSAAPASAQADTTQDGLTCSVDVTPESQAGGTLYRATISVTDGTEQVYTLETASYVGGGSS